MSGTTVVAIQNPGVTEASLYFSSASLTPEQVIEAYGPQVEQGAFVSVTLRDMCGGTESVQQFVANRVENHLYLQNNEYMDQSDIAANPDNIGAVVAGGPATPATPEEPLETYTVFGNNDDDENFVAVVTATDETVEQVGIQAGLVDEGYEADVTIAAILRGDQSDLESVSI